MKPIPLNAPMLEVARRIIWFEPAPQALAQPARFLAYAMTYARHEDMQIIRRYVSDDDIREALNLAPAGIMDPRSWAYWNCKMGRYPAPPLPRRSIPTTGSLLAGSHSAHRTAAEDLRREGRAAWQKMKAAAPATADADEVRRRAREEWLAKYGPDKHR